METFKAELKLIKPNSMMASVDLRHEYYSVRIHEQDRNFFDEFEKEKFMSTLVNQWEFLVHQEYLQKL